MPISCASLLATYIYINICQRTPLPSLVIELYFLITITCNHVHLLVTFLNMYIMYNYIGESAFPLPLKFSWIFAFIPILMLLKNLLDDYYLFPSNYTDLPLKLDYCVKPKSMNATVSCDVLKRKYL